MATAKVNKLRITKEFGFSAGHYLRGHNHCGKLHGHNYKLFVTIEGEINSSGFLIDFYELKQIVKGKIIDKLDHPQEGMGLLNDIFPFDPTCENMCIWIFDELAKVIDNNRIQLIGVRLYETDSSYCEYGKF